MTVFSADTDDCGSWNGGFCGVSLPRVSLDISSYASPNCQVRFTYFDENDWCWYAAIDTVSITSMAPIDIGVSQINSPISSCNSSSMEPIEVKFFNFGTDTIFNFTITCDTDNVTQTFSERVNFTCCSIRFNGLHFFCNYAASGSTPTFLAGPDSAYAGNNLLYFEPAFNSAIDTAVIKSTCLAFRNDTLVALDFFY